MNNNKMKSIKFSHDYYKLQTMSGQIYMADLVGVSKCKPEILPEQFLKDDTEYSTETTKERYPLNERIEHLVLFLYVEKHNYVFTTIRRWTPEKEEYYESLIGQKLKMDRIE